MRQFGPVPSSATAAGVSQIIWHQCTSAAPLPLPPPMLKLLHLYDVLPAADIKSEVELWRAAAPQLRRGKSSGAPRRSGRHAFSVPSPGNSRGSLATGVVTPRCKIQTKGATERHRGWQRINEQTKQTTHRSSPKLTAKQVVNNPPVGAALAPQEQEHRGQRDP